MISLNNRMKNEYGGKVYRLALDAGLTCPNRDGTLGDRGCIFCSAGGSGEFGGDRRLPIKEQLAAGKEIIRKKVPGCRFFIAYFQAFTNTYGKIDYLEKIYREAADDSEVVVVSIATRPDCLGKEIIKLLADINKIKPVWVELGLQTSKETTAAFIRRGYRNNVYEEAVAALHEAGIEVITHVILGLPGESREDMLNTCRYVAKNHSEGIKLQILNVLKGTDLADYYYEHPFHIMDLQEYKELLRACLQVLPEDMTIHRLTVDAPKKILIEPQWVADKKKVVNALRDLTE